MTFKKLNFFFHIILFFTSIPLMECFSLEDFQHHKRTYTISPPLKSQGLRDSISTEPFIPVKVDSISSDEGSLDMSETPVVHKKHHPLFYFQKDWQELQKLIEGASLDTLKLVYNEFSEISEDFGKWKEGVHFFQKRAQEKKDPRFFMFMQWPGQTDREAIGAYLFFPTEIENFLHLDGISVYNRLIVQYKLAICAYLKNPVAQHHLSNLFGVYANEDVPEDFFLTISQSWERRSHDAFAAFLSFKTSETSEVLFYKGLSAAYLNKNDDALTFFQRDLTNHRSALETAGLSSSENAHKIYVNLQENLASLPFFIKGKIMVYFAEGIDDAETRLREFIRIGEDGFAEGFYLAALMSPNPADQKRLFQQAGDSGMTSAYMRAADILINMVSKENMEKTLTDLEILFSKMKKKGDASGYRKLAKLYENQLNNPLKKEEALGKADFMNDHNLEKHYTSIQDLATKGKIE
ncbi:MAG: hypothetical protein JSS34_05280 [Proteobacteria bacterium]|nr:hypothetical protein [Pseudomonadota bacterium]